METKQVTYRAMWARGVKLVHRAFLLSVEPTYYASREVMERRLDRIRSLLHEAMGYLTSEEDPLESR
ncbi:MAG: hypothetical protein KM310_06950 [Clostridiales bacterium]|nr:hypothetical protein [Clostridiales bacterium]